MRFYPRHGSRPWRLMPRDDFTQARLRTCFTCARLSAGRHLPRSQNEIKSTPRLDGRWSDWIQKTTTTLGHLREGLDPHRHPAHL